MDQTEMEITDLDEYMTLEECLKLGLNELVEITAFDSSYIGIGFREALITFEILKRIL